MSSILQAPSSFGSSIVDVTSSAMSYVGKVMDFSGISGIDPVVDTLEYQDYLNYIPKLRDISSAHQAYNGQVRESLNVAKAYSNLSKKVVSFSDPSDGEMFTASLTGVSEIADMFSYISTMGESINKAATDATCIASLDLASKGIKTAKSGTSLFTAGITLSGADLSSTLETISKSLAGALVLERMVSLSTKVVQLTEVSVLKEKLEEGGKGALARMYRKDNDLFKEFAPKTYAKLKAGHLLTDTLVAEAKEELGRSRFYLSILAFFKALSIGSAVASLLCLEGTAAGVLAILSLLSSSISLGDGVTTFFKKIESYNSLSKTDLAINSVVAIVTFAVTLLSIFAAPTALVGAYIGVTGLASLGVSIGSMIYLKIKEERLKRERNDSFASKLVRYVNPFPLMRKCRQKGQLLIYS